MIALVLCFWITPFLHLCTELHFSHMCQNSAYTPASQGNGIPLIHLLFTPRPCLVSSHPPHTSSEVWKHRRCQELTVMSSELDANWHSGREMHGISSFLAASRTAALAHPWGGVSSFPLLYSLSQRAHKAWMSSRHGLALPGRFSQRFFVMRTGRLINAWCSRTQRSLRDRAGSIMGWKWGIFRFPIGLYSSEAPKGPRITVSSILTDLFRL